MHHGSRSLPSMSSHATQNDFGERRRKNRPAWSRRQQQIRSDTRACTRLLAGLRMVEQHRGGQLNKVGKALKHILENERCAVRHDRSFDASQYESGHHNSGGHSDSGFHANVQYQEEFHPGASFWTPSYTGEERWGIPTLPYMFPPPTSATQKIDSLSSKLEDLKVNLQRWQSDDEKHNNEQDTMLEQLEARLHRKLEDMDINLAATIRAIGHSETRITRDVASKHAEMDRRVSELVFAFNQLLQANGAASQMHTETSKQCDRTQQALLQLLESRLDDQRAHSNQFEALLTNAHRQSDIKLDAINTQLQMLPVQTIDILASKFESFGAKLAHESVSEVPQVQTIERIVDVTIVSPQAQTTAKVPEVPKVQTFEPIESDSALGKLEGLRMVLRQHGAQSQELTAKIDTIAKKLDKVDGKLSDALETTTCIEGALRATKFTANFQNITHLLENLSAATPQAGSL